MLDSRSWMLDSGCLQGGIMGFQSYKDLEIYKVAHRLAIEIHQMSLKLPKFEIYEEGNQIRKSSKSICSNIVEGFGRRRYKNEFIQFLTYALASCDETREHLDLLWDTGSLKDKDVYRYFTQKYEELGKKLTKFIQAVERSHLTSKSSNRYPVSSIQHPVSRKGQALLFVFFLLLIVGILAGALAVMWPAEIKTRGLERDGLIAFYLAQAGVERAKIELAYNETWTGGGPYSFGGGTYTVSVQNVACPPGPYNTCREITSIGRIASVERRITCTVSLDKPPLDPPDTPGDEEMVSWSWREI